MSVSDADAKTKAQLPSTVVKSVVACLSLWVHFNLNKTTIGTVDTFLNKIIPIIHALKKLED